MSLSKLVLKISEGELRSDESLSEIIDMFRFHSNSDSEYPAESFVKGDVVLACTEVGEVAIGCRQLREKEEVCLNTGRERLEDREGHG
jgi:hypothetical protein